MFEQVQSFDHLYEIDYPYSSNYSFEGWFLKRKASKLSEQVETVHVVEASKNDMKHCGNWLAYKRPAMLTHGV